MPDPLRLRRLLTGLLDSAESWVPRIERTFVSQGRPIPECEVLAVWADSILAPNPSKAPCSILPRAQFHVTLYQCVPVSSNSDALERSALDLADDAWAIWTGILAGFRDGTLFGEEEITCGTIDLSRGMIALPNGGGFGGWEATIIIDL